MIRQEFSRINPKRQSKVNHKRKQFEQPQFKQQDYHHRLRLYSLPPTEEITLEEFEECSIHRLKVLAELEACSFRNKSFEETQDHMQMILQKHMPLSQNTSRSTEIESQRKRDHYSHFILRLAFSATEDLRHRFSRLETQLFRLRFQNEDARARQAFVDSLDFDWERVTDDEKRELSTELLAATPGMRNSSDEGWFKVDWEKVPELVEHRRVFLKRGKAFVPAREQASMIVSEFTLRLDQALELTARALPRLDEDDRLAPILNHLSQNFNAPGASYSESEQLPGAAITYQSIDPLSQHFPLCMRNLHTTLRQNSHLKHFGRLQYTLFLKGIGLSLEDCILFWRQSFKLMTDEKFNKEYKYNIRHAYGDVGGDANRRGRGYTPYSCQKLLTEAMPGPGQMHGCPYRTFSPDNLVSMLQATGVNEREVVKGVIDDVGRQRFHIACNRVFEWANKGEIKKVKDEGTWSSSDLDTILHPNTYFKRSYLLKNLGAPSGEVEMES